MNQMEERRSNHSPAAAKKLHVASPQEAGRKCRGPEDENGKEHGAVLPQMLVRDRR